MPLGQNCQQNCRIPLLALACAGDRDIVRPPAVLGSKAKTSQCPLARSGKAGMLKLTSAPQSRTTGNCLAGWIPAQTVVKTNFATDIRIPPTPWSPIPRIYHPLVNVSERDEIIF